MAPWWPSHSAACTRGRLRVDGEIAHHCAAVPTTIDDRAADIVGVGDDARTTAAAVHGLDATAHRRRLDPCRRVPKSPTDACRGPWLEGIAGTCGAANSVQLCRELCGRNRWRPGAWSAIGRDSLYSVSLVRPVLD
jgi:hypothetical protein